MRPLLVTAFFRGRCLFPHFSSQMMRLSEGSVYKGVTFKRLNTVVV